MVLRLYGRFSLSRDGHDIEFPARTAAQIVAYCALHRGSARRSDVAGALWPSADDDTARTNLRTALHRVRKTASTLIQAEDDVLKIAPIEIDADEADRLHRQYLLAPNDSSALEALSKEWAIRRQPLLDGWDDEWIEPLRTSAEYASAELGRELARAAEALGESRLALETWRQVHQLHPLEVEALKHLIRLESEINGASHALQVAEAIQSQLQGDAPPQLRAVLASLKAGVLELVPKPELLRTRSEILLLARMFESNLKANGEEAMELLIVESRKEVSSHPRTAFSLVQLGLSETAGDSPTRVRLAMLATVLGSWIGEYEIAHHWASFALDKLDPNSAEYVETLGGRGFMFLEQREYDRAEEILREALAIARRHGYVREELANGVRLAGVLLHTLRFEEAIALYEASANMTDPAVQPMHTSAQAATGYNTAVIRCMQGDWGAARAAAEKCMSYAETIPIYQWLGASPLGLALYQTGEREEGIRQVMHGVASTAREKLLRYHQIALDFAAMILALEGRPQLAQDVIEINSVYRSSLRHLRSEAELKILREVSGLPVIEVVTPGNTLAQQSVGTTTSWVCDALASLVA